MRRDEKRVSSQVTRNAMALAVSALLFGAVSASAQSDIVLQASKTSAKAGRWAVVSDSGAAGGAKIRHADGGAAKIDHGLREPGQLLRAHVLGDQGCSVPAVGARPGRRRRLGQRFGLRAVLRQRQLVGRRGLPHRHDVGDRSQPRGLQRLRPRAAGQWQDNGWGHGVLGPVIYFATTGTQRMRVQTREDGLSIDRIILSPSQLPEREARRDLAGLR